MLRAMADAAFSLADDIRRAGLSAEKRADAERRRAPKTSTTVALDELLATVSKSCYVFPGYHPYLVSKSC